jgi:hypothetical protein
MRRRGPRPGRCKLVKPAKKLADIFRPGERDHPYDVRLEPEPRLRCPPERGIRPGNKVLKPEEIGDAERLRFSSVPMR